MVMIIILVCLVSVYMMIAGQMKSDKTAILWGRILFFATVAMLSVLWFTVYK